MNNRLFCTFSTEENIDLTLSKIKNSYEIPNRQKFILYSFQRKEYAFTYNVDEGNVNNFIDNTILVHRKKETNTLYTINALNALIRLELNQQFDPNYIVDWTKHRNCILTTTGTELKKDSTKLFSIEKL